MVVSMSNFFEINLRNLLYVICQDIMFILLHLSFIYASEIKIKWMYSAKQNTSI